MKKILFVLFLLIVFISPVFAANWVEIFEKKYIDMSSLEPDYNSNTIMFWVKNLRKDPNDTFPNFEGKNVPYWYSMAQWQLDCTNKKSQIHAYAIYDLKQEVIFSTEHLSDWGTIIPETYADGYYRLFCIAPFKDNPILNK